MLVRLVTDKLAPVCPVISLKLVLSDEDCHRIAPVFPVVDNVAPEPEQMVVAPATVPATETGVTVILTESVVSELQAPLVTITL